MVQGRTVCKWQNWLPNVTPEPMPASFLTLLASPLFSTQQWTWHESLLYLSRSKFGCRTCSSPGKICRWNKVWREPVGGAGLAGWGLHDVSLEPTRGAGTKASRQHARFIKSHQEHRLGTAVIYLHFSLVKCYWLFYTKGSLSWMGCTGIQFTSIFCQLCSPPPLASEVIYGSERGSHFLSERGEKSWWL